MTIIDKLHEYLREQSTPLKTSDLSKVVGYKCNSLLLTLEKEGAIRRVEQGYGRGMQSTWEYAGPRRASRLQKSVLENAVTCEWASIRELVARTGLTRQAVAMRLDRWEKKGRVEKTTGVRPVEFRFPVDTPETSA